MRIYIVIVEDGHTDTKAYPFTTAEKAIEYAKEAALVGADGESDQIEEDEVEGWLYCATYSCEGDSVWVVEQELDSPYED